MNAVTLNDAYIVDPDAIINVVIYVDDLKSANESFETYLSVRFSHRIESLTYHFIHMSLARTRNAVNTATKDDYIVFLETQIAQVLERYMSDHIHVIFVFDNEMLVAGGKFQIESYLAYLVDLQDFPQRMMNSDSPLKTHDTRMRDASILVWAANVKTPVLKALSKRNIPVVPNTPLLGKVRLEPIGREIEDVLR